MKNFLLVLSILIAVTSFGDTLKSGVFHLNTLHLVAQASSSAFSCGTDQLRDQQTSILFNCATDQLRDQQASVVFFCNSQTPKYGSVIFIADTHSLLLDGDGNGMPNIWEMQYFGSTTNTAPTNDADHDGKDNRAEYIAGTNPQDYESIFAVYINSDNGCVEWPTVLNRVYSLQYAPDLAIPFSDVSGQTDILGTGGDVVVPCLSLDESGFFRVNVRLR